MTEEELQDRLSLVFQERYNSIVEESIREDESGSRVGSSVSLGIYERVARRAIVKWDACLNKLDVIRREAHLKEKEPPRNHIRIVDPFCMGNFGRRWLDVPLYLADRIIWLGIP